MANINAYLEAIMEAVYGEDVRGSIHDAIEIINDVSEVVLSTGTAVSSASSSSEGYYTDSLYFNTTTQELWKCIGTDSWESQGVLKGDQGDPGSPGADGADGVGISSIAKTSTSGLIDTYTITYTNGNTDTFTVTNGANGTNGRGIASITKTATAGLVDTYTITYSDTTTSTFDVTNGVVGNKWYTGTVISGKSSTPTIFSGSGITYANTGDMYLNTSEGAIYHCDDPGDASTATWVYDFTLAGGGGGAEVLSDLTDVTISSLVSGQFLKYGGSVWENATLDYSDVGNTPVVDSSITSGSTNAVEAQAIYAALALKQDTLTIDTIPTSGSSNPVSSGGVYSSLGDKQDTLTAGNGIDITSNTISVDADSVPTNASTKPITSGGVYSALDSWIAATGTVSSGQVTFSGIDDTANRGYEPFAQITSASTNKNPSFEITSLSGDGTSNMSVTFKTDADNGATVKLRVFK